MTADGFYQVSEIKGNITVVTGKPWTSVRITGYDTLKKAFTRAMIGDSPGVESVAMEGPWNEATHSFTMPFRTINTVSGEEHNMKGRNKEKL